MGMWTKGTQEKGDFSPAWMANLQIVQKGPEAWHNPPAPTPINSNKLFTAEQKKNAALSPSQVFPCVLHAQAPSSQPHWGASFIPRER